ncbi:MAG TPA: hypothetical protein VMF30_20000 [Pirellulales bacterium]|nr:hypothetical protein [Pirellulales bacterium]
MFHKKIAWFRRVDDGKLFKAWRRVNVRIENDQSGRSRLVENESEVPATTDGRRIYSADQVDFFLEGEPTRPLRLARQPAVKRGAG